MILQPEQLELVLRQLRYVLHENHYLITDCKRRLIDIYGPAAGFEYDKLSKEVRYREVLAVARRLTGGECAGAGAEVRLLRPPALPPGRPLPRQVRVPRVSVSVLSGVVASVEDVGVIADISCGRDTEQC